MGMSSSQPQPLTQGTMGSPTKNYGPIGDMASSAQNQVNPQSSPTGAMNNLMGSLPGHGIAPQQNGPTQFTPGQGGMSGGMMPTNYTPQQPQVAQINSMGNPGFMPMGNAGFMPMGNHNFMPMGFGQMPQQPQMPTFGGPRPGKAPQTPQATRSAQVSPMNVNPATSGINAGWTGQSPAEYMSPVMSAGHM